ncbi:hypothetical protein SPRG_17518 [Saprolegnia parasitica CBS 223.65]|uniref:glucan endo-1,3-beta-D-glucosidase n=1 Tax=Saprolegnia parasitica (strain CBS 223.65) TaxID=695850 RepID=A0A067BQN7_SAPPC|nr:hypothetical protein SPRG_17518 [Saprolegnia parasitica CBS 223.65]KDO16997.1 hypothetical protein SPRG_17518 [Saprolegnia parasitica CBS 223.65]|eukprot:XP_012212293.1 hypothetical protein SPRG_17518 [Saprolegnia parasitica CBS 223.65]
MLARLFLLAGLAVASATPIRPSACYSPFHLDSYPLQPWEALDAPALAAGINEDFAQMKPYVHTVRTYYSKYHSVDVAPIAAANGVPVYLGVYMVHEPWYWLQVAAAIDGAVAYPETVRAVLVGNENVAPYGDFAAAYIANQVQHIKSEVANRTNGSIVVPVGTVQRITEWLNPAIRTEMLALADACDVIGVNIYPFFDNGYDALDPTALVTALWDQMLAIYPAHKLRLTETGYSTGGPSPSVAPRVVPSLDNAIKYYNALMQWTPSRGGGDIFWYSFYNLRDDDTTQPEPLEKHFGYFNANGTAKAANFPKPRRHRRPLRHRLRRPLRRPLRHLLRHLL